MKLPELKSETFRATHRASVVAILGDNAPDVRAEGTAFYNVDRWTARFLVDHLTRWAKENPGKTPSAAEIADFQRAIQREKQPSRKIVTAAIPNELSQTVAMALVGGAYHESFHSLYSCTRNIKTSEIERLVNDHWSKIPDWGTMSASLLTWSNIVEDIRIERRGCEQYPGAKPKLEHLQDFILNAEAPIRERFKPLDVIQATFRDLGLGYSTPHQALALEAYQTICPAAVEFVETDLRDLLTESQNLTIKDDLGNLRIAMAICVRLHEKSQEEPEASSMPGESDTEGEEQPSEGDKQGEDPVKGDEKTEGQGDESGEDASESADGEGPEDGSNEPSPEESSDDSSESNDEDGSASGDDESSDDGSGSLSEALRDAMYGSDGGETLLTDLSSALQEAFDACRAEEDASAAEGEAPYRPSAAHLDSVDVVDGAGGYLKDEVSHLIELTRQDTTFLRSRMRALIRAMNETAVHHGVRKGYTLSERMFTDSKIALREGRMPDRAYQVTDDRIDTSFAASVVLDQSGSMYSQVPWAIQALTALTDSLSYLGCPVQVIGFQERYSHERVVPVAGAHRHHGVKINVFKGFNESFPVCKARLAGLMTGGGTPLADGIQYGWEGLRTRREKRRVMFVITDGEPNDGHEEVMRWQIRNARREGILIVGVGVGYDARYVNNVFDDAIWADTFDKIPPLLISKLTDIYRRMR